LVSLQGNIGRQQPPSPVNYGLLTFAGCLFLFQFANASMLPLAGEELVWRAVQGLLDRWACDPAKDFPIYAAGSQGPEAADRLLARDGRAWVAIRAGHPHTALRP
jgi:hypothetical protein